MVHDEHPDHWKYIIKGYVMSSNGEQLDYVKVLNSLTGNATSDNATSGAVTNINPPAELSSNTLSLPTLPAHLPAKHVLKLKQQYR
jgi:hypothetical protein